MIELRPYLLLPLPYNSTSIKGKKNNSIKMELKNQRFLSLPLNSLFYFQTFVFV